MKKPGCSQYRQALVESLHCLPKQVSLAAWGHQQQQTGMMKIVVPKNHTEKTTRGCWRNGRKGTPQTYLLCPSLRETVVKAHGENNGGLEIGNVISRSQFVLQFLPQPLEVVLRSGSTAVAHCAALLDNK